MTLEELLESIRTRETKSLYGIGLAAAYVGGVAGCLTGSGLCPTKIFEKATPKLWAKELAEASGRLTYCDESTSDSDFMQKSVREGTDIASGAVLEYDCVLSSKRKDRDLDVIEQKGGLELDLKQPALWQHIQLQPIGKLVKLLDQDEFVTKCRYALADTELGREAATLVKFGALRKSIGFKPSEFSPLEIVKGADGRDVVRGWHIKKALGMEGSLVSIPANADANILAHYAKEFDAICTVHSRGLLKNELTKHWAKSLADRRPVQAAGFSLETKEACGCQKSLETKTGPKEPLPLESPVDVTQAPKCPECKAPMLDSGKCSKCSYVKPKSAETVEHKMGDCGACKCGGKMADGKCEKCGKAKKAVAELFSKDVGPLTSKMYGSSPYPAGSFEAIQWQLRNSAKAYLESKGIAFITDSYTDLVATLPGSAVVCVSPYSSRAKNTCYQISYSAKDGGVEFDGEPVVVELQTQIVAKALAAHPTFDSARVASDAVAAEHPAKLARVLIGKSCVDAEAVAAVREVAKTAPVHDLKSAIDLDSLFAK